MHSLHFNKKCEKCKILRVKISSNISRVFWTNDQFLTSLVFEELCRETRNLKKNLELFSTFYRFVRSNKFYSDKSE